MAYSQVGSPYGGGTPLGSAYGGGLGTPLPGGRFGGGVHASPYGGGLDAPPPGSATQQPYAPLLFSSPGAAHGGAGAYGGSPAPSHAGAGTAGYFTGGGAGPVLTPGGSARGFFGGGVHGGTPGAHPSAGGKRIFGGGVATDAPPSGGDRSPRLGPSSAANDATAGHMGTPWADRRARRERAEASRDDLDLAADPDVPSSSASSSRWVTVFGYAPDRLADVLRELQRDGDILRHEGDGDANWRHVQFSDVEGARRALRRDGRRVGGAMVGVKPATAEDVSRLDDRRDETDAPARVVRPAAGMTAPSARAHRVRPTREGVALQPRRSAWGKIVEFVFGM